MSAAFDADTKRHAEAARRERICQAAIALKEGDPLLSQRNIARRLREDHATLSRYLRAYEAGGYESLLPKQKDACGRGADYQLTEPECAALRLLRLKKGSLALAIEFFADDPACEPATREQIKAALDDSARKRRPPSWPLSLRRAGHVTVEHEAEFRGTKSVQVLEHCDRRGLWWEDDAGVRHPLEPNTLWESDDQSTNEPFSFVDPEAGTLCTGRQTLCTDDFFAGAWLSGSPIGRARDAYRAEDIADHMLETVLAHGLPQFWRLERGRWENAVIDGVKLDDGTRWGGLDGLVGIIRTWKSRGKGGIESGFNLLQAMSAHESLSIGRKRGEFEAATKVYLRAGAGDQAAAAQFWSIEEYAAAMVAAMERFNGRPKQRRAFGRDLVVPADLYAGAVRRECPADQLWRFSPVKRPATVRQGHVEFHVPHYPLPFRFRVNGEQEGLYLEHGFSVLVAFHPGHPERGCYVFNAERGSRNRQGWRVGEPLLLAPCAEDAPQFALSRDEQAFMARKAARAGVTTEFRAIKAAGKRGDASRVSTVRDSFGRSARLGNRPEPASALPISSPRTEHAGEAENRTAARPGGMAAEAPGSRAVAARRGLETINEAEIAERTRLAREALGLFD